MKIDKHLLSAALKRAVDTEVVCSAIGLVNSTQANTLAFLDDLKFLPELQSNRNITAVITLPQHGEAVQRAGKAVLVSDDPRYDFFTVWNHISLESHVVRPTVIDKTAIVHPRAYVADHNVRIGAGCEIEAMACIMPDVEIGDRTIIRAGAVIGTEGYEKKITTKGVLSVRHTGKVIIQSDVEIGANACVAKGMHMIGDTRIGKGTKINSLAFIGHSVSIGMNCLIHLSASVSGSSKVGDNVWIGPKATVSGQLKIGDGARISIGSVVTRDVPPGRHVTGNFAIDHETFLRKLKETAR